MRRLRYTLDLELFKKIKKDIVPALFTEHQFNLIKKKFTNKKMSDSEKNEFSRTISKKMNAINKILEKETSNMFVYGKDKIKTGRLKLAITYIKKFSRIFKNKHLIISGSFLYSDKYNDIDIFVVSKYEKEDYRLKKFHINYLAEDVYPSLFFASIKRLCVSNKKIINYKIKEKAGINTFISIYQELFNDLDRSFKGIKATLREFLLQAAFIGKAPIPDSLELKQQIDSILKLKKPNEIIKKIFVKTIVLGISHKKAVAAMKEMVKSYKDILKEYKQHKNYYLKLMQAFDEVVAIES